MHGHRMSQEFNMMNGLVKDNICHLPAAVSKDDSKDKFHILDLTSPYLVLQPLSIMLQASQVVIHLKFCIHDRCSIW